MLSTVLRIKETEKVNVYIMDAFADKIVLDLIRWLQISVILVVKTKTLLTKLDISRYNRQYHNLKIIYSDSFHNRYFILDSLIERINSLT